MLFGPCPRQYDTMRDHLYRLLILLLFMVSASAQAGSDAAKEKRWADQIVDSLIDGEAVWLQAGDHRFLAIYTPSDAPAVRGAAILLHGIGAHPDWPEVIHPLRTALPEHGWATLSIQLPVLPNEAGMNDYLPLFDEVAPRINAAMAYLKQQNILNQVLIAHSLGTTMAGHYLAGKPDPAIRAWVGISMIESRADPRLSNVAALMKIRLPVLDIYGSQDLDSVRLAAPARKRAARAANNRGYAQVEVDGADHFFSNREDELIRRIRGWLKRQADGMEVP